MTAQDAAELFDLVDERGTLLGRTKRRDEVHRDGDWHRALHVWVVLRGAPPRLLLQRRSLAKDTWPGAVDVAVGGHLRAGEGIVEALRESEEEIGLPLGLADVVPLGFRAWVSDGAMGGRPGGAAVRDREVQYAFAALVERALTDFRPHPEELSSLLALPLDVARALYHGEVTEASAEELGLDGQVRAVTLRRDECVKSTDGYPARALDALVELAAGGTPAPIAIPAPLRSEPDRA
jgi:isopentenyldiphosphate isomerase